MTDILELWQKISTIGFGPLCAGIIYTSFKGVWIWGTQLTKFEALWAKSDAAWEVRLAKSEQDALQWRSLAMQLAGVAEISVHIAKTAKIAKGLERQEPAP